MTKPLRCQTVWLEKGNGRNELLHSIEKIQSKEFLSYCQCHICIVYNNLVSAKLHHLS